MKLLKIAFKTILLFFGSISLLMLILSFSDIPYFAYHALGSSDSDTLVEPKNIIVMGGDGMPAPGGLIRLYYAAKKAKQFPSASIILALPMNQEQSFRQLDLMAEELIVRGVDSNRIVYEPRGFNTRSQALEISEILSAEKDKNILIITSPEHIFRATKTFEKVGFTKVFGLPTFEEPSDEAKLKDKTKSRDRRIKNLNLRYNMWSYLNYEILVLREYTAIAYYWIKGWI